MAKEWKNKLAGIQAPRDPRADGLGLGDYFARHAGFVVPDGFPAGTIAPASVPDSASREQLRKKLASELRNWDHEELAQVAAALLEGSFLWRGVFAKYAKDKEIELCEVKAEMYQRLHEAHTEALDILADPVTRAYLNAGAKLARDPKQAAKAEAFKLWSDWQAGKTLHKSGAAFARFVCDKYPVLESPTTVERWARKWAVEKSKNRH
ncbi:hypothetical protein [Rhodanobacter soli]|uniref:Uncharacterized protein n=1 Tax=Rhodanobacter soli TaxID=590609 RepID=A0ABV2Q007_9GAMM